MKKQTDFKKAYFDSIKLLGVPLVAFLVLRFFLRDILQFRVGFLGFTDFDLIPPGLCAGFLLFQNFFRSSPVSLRPTFKRVISYLSFIAVFLLVSVLAKHMQLKAGSVGYWFWLAYGVGLVLGSIFVCVPLSYFYSHSRRVLIIPAIGLALSKVVWVHVASPLWEPTAKLTGKVSYGVLSLMVGNLDTHIRIVGERTYTQILHPLYSVAVGAGCSGLEGMFFFSSIWAFLALIKGEPIRSFRWFVSLLGGLVLFYFLNVLRIMIFFLVALGSVYYFGSSAYSILGGPLHVILGWFMYTLAVYWYWDAFQAAVTVAKAYKPSPNGLVST